MSGDKLYQLRVIFTASAELSRDDLDAVMDAAIETVTASAAVDVSSAAVNVRDYDPSVGPVPFDVASALEHVAYLVARDGEDRTDGECMEDVWGFLVSIGVDPDGFRTVEVF